MSPPRALIFVVVVAMYAIATHASGVVNCAGTWDESPVGTLSIGAATSTTKHYMVRRVTGPIAFHSTAPHRAGVMFVRTVSGSLERTLPGKQFQCTKSVDEDTCVIDVDIAAYFQRIPGAQDQVVEIKFFERGKYTSCIRSTDNVEFN